MKENNKGRFNRLSLKRLYSEYTKSGNGNNEIIGIGTPTKAENNNEKIPSFEQMINFESEYSVEQSSPEGKFKRSGFFLNPIQTRFEDMPPSEDMASILAENDSPTKHYNFLNQTNNENSSPSSSVPFQIRLNAISNQTSKDKSPDNDEKSNEVSAITSPLKKKKFNDPSTEIIDRHKRLSGLSVITPASNMKAKKGVPWNMSSSASNFFLNNSTNVNTTNISEQEKLHINESNKVSKAKNQLGNLLQNPGNPFIYFVKEYLKNMN
jgi:hypothetical protein